MITSNTPQLPRGAIGFAVGIAGMLVSLYYSIAFIVGTATGAEVVAGIVFAVLMDYAKVALGSEALLALASFRLFSAVSYTLIVISLYSLSMFSATFMLASHNANSSLQAQTTQVESLQADIEAKRAELAKCNSSHLSKCVNPRTAELSALQAQLSDARKLSATDVKAKNIATTWDKFAQVMGDAPDSLQVKLSFARAFLLEIVSPLLVSIFLAYYRNRMATPGANAERIINPEPVVSNALQGNSQPLPVSQPEAANAAVTNAPQLPASNPNPTLNGYSVKW